MVSNVAFKLHGTRRWCHTTAPRGDLAPLKCVEHARSRWVRLSRQAGMPSGGAAKKATCNKLGGGGGGLSAAGKARRCVPPPGAPAGGEQEGAGNQQARDAGAAQRDDQHASAWRTVGLVSVRICWR